jgi:hypothetical protein
VREIGERYRDGASIATIAAELELPFSKTERALSTYYLLFAEPPLDGVRSIAFSNGKRYYRDGQPLEELEAETRDTAEKHVREFVGRTLIDGDLDSVDIDEPVPEMEVPSLNVLSELAIEGPLFTEYQSMMDAVMPDTGLMFEKMMSGVVDQIQQDMQTMVNQRLRGIQQAVRVSGIGRNAMAPALASSALATTISASAVSAIEPSVFHVMNQPALHGLGMITETYTLQIEQLAQILTQPVTRDIAFAFQSFPSAIELVNQSATVGFAESMMSLSDSVAEITMMGAVAARPEINQVFNGHRIDWPSVAIEPTVEPEESNDWLLARIELPSPNHHPLLYVGIADLVITQLAFIYPEHAELMYASPAFKLVLGIYLWKIYRR